VDILLYCIIGVLICLITMSAYFSACETAYTGLNTIRIKNLIYEGHKNAEKAMKNHDEFERLLATILVGNNLVNAAISTLVAVLFSMIFGAIGAVIAFVFSATVILIFGEITPKTLANRNSERYALKFAGSIHIIMVLLSPISWAFTKLSGSLAGRAKNDSEDTPSFTEDELFVMIDEIEEEGTLEKSESELIKSAIQFDDIKVSEIYTPKKNITAVDVRIGAEEMKNLFKETEYSRIPVYDGSIDRIIGAVHSKDFFSRYVDDDSMLISDIIRPVKFVPENTSIATLLNDLQKAKIHLAIVLDNFGGTLGLVSLEDVLEELVGDIWDESDEVSYPIVEEKDGSYTILGEANIHHAMERMNLKFDAGDFEENNVSAFVSHNIEGIPRKGDVIDLRNMKVIVKSMKGRRVKEARIVPKTEEEIIHFDMGITEED
jgi:Hemolysins and related proteins containing CBS domains